MLSANEAKYSKSTEVSTFEEDYKKMYPRPEDEIT